MIWYSFLFLINAYKHKLVARVNSLYNNLNNNLNNDNNNNNITNNELPIKHFYLNNNYNYTTGIDNRYNYNNETKIQNENELNQIIINFQKKKILHLLLDKKISIHNKISLIKKFDVLDIDTVRACDYYINVFANSDFESSDFE